MVTKDSPAGYARVDRYIRRDARTIPGYLRSLDLDVICSLGRWQSDAGLEGDLAEIGVHHGKLFLALATLRRPGERAVAIDLFEDDKLNRHGRHAGRSTALSFHAERLAIPLSPSEIIKADSTTLDPERIGALAASLRLVSIDGDHGERVVSGDLALAAGALADWGIIALDDFSNAEWPGVRRATLDFLQQQTRDFGAFLVTPGKLYLARRPWVERYSRVIASDLALSTAIHGHVDLLGVPVATLKLSFARGLERFAHELIGLPIQYAHRFARRGG